MEVYPLTFKKEMYHYDFFFSRSYKTSRTVMQVLGLIILLVFFPLVT